MSFWTVAEMQTLARLRTGFLNGTAGQTDYWREEGELELYDRTFAQRIGWKWNAVLGELSLRHWSPPSRRLVDWGCGTGIAARRVLEHWPDAFDSLVLSDRSPRARAFAHGRVRFAHPQMNVQVAAPDAVECADSVVLLSHVLSELNDAQLLSVLNQVKKAAAIIWVESATHDNSRRLVSDVREPLLAAGWNAVAPCTHCGACPLLSEPNERHWCHHFAKVPSEAHQDSGWRELSERLNVDLRVLPYSFIVLDRQPTQSKDVGLSRVVGTPREFKGYLKVLACDATGLTDWMLQKRDAPELFKNLRRGGRVPLYRWRTEGQRIVEGCEE